MQRNIIRILQRQICRRILIDLNHSTANTVFLAGSGRSGTTWVADLINSLNRYRMIFEPFHCVQSNLWRNFPRRLYLRVDNQDSRYVKPIKKVLTGKVRSLWFDSQNRKIISHKRLVKAVNANLFLYWIHVHFPETKIILLLRNPCAVAVSSINLGWGADLAKLLQQPDLTTDFLLPFAEAMRQAKTEFERFIFAWCVDSYVPLKQFKKDGIYVAFYENLCINPVKEVRSLCEFLNIPFSMTALKHINLPSTKTSADSAIVTGNNLVNGWKEKVTDDQLCRAHDIISIFGLDELYSGSFLPNYSNGITSI